MSRSRNLFLSLVVGCLVATSVVGQVTLSGNISDGSGGPLLSGVVYHATGDLTVPTGSTLTIQAGAIIKFTFDKQMTVNGQLVAQGTMAAPIVLTSIEDDTAGGDTNGNGPSVGVPDSWRSLRFNATATGTVSYLQLRFAGRLGLGGIEVNGSTVAFNDCTVSDCSAAGLTLNNTATASTFTSCQFTNNNRAVEGVRLENVPNFTSNTASGNTVNDCLSVSSGTIASGTTTITTSNMISNVILCPTNITVAAGSTLAIDQGCIIKMAFDRQVTVNGTLNCSGSSASPVIFTSLVDDAHGGDSNNDGTNTAPGPDSWRTIAFNNGSGPSQLAFTEIWYGGRLANAGFEVQDASVDMDHCAARFCNAAGLDLNNQTGTVTVTNCDFSDNDRAVVGVPLAALPGFVNNTASNNAAHDTIEISSASLSSGATAIAAVNMLSNVVICPSINVAAGATLSLGQGCILKMNFDRQVTVSGVLTCSGTPGAPVVFTSLEDDSAGGDTNHDGTATLPAPDHWRGVILQSGSASSTLVDTHVRYAGRLQLPGIRVADDVTLRSCTVLSCNSDGIQLTGSARPIIEDCLVDSCGQVAYADCEWGALSGFANNQAVNNGGNYVSVSSGAVGVDDRVFAHSAPHGVVVVTANPSFTATSSLILEAGVIVKMSFDRQFSVLNGRFEARGTSFAPVVMTSFVDDDFGGDSNNNGASSVAGDYWRGLSVGLGALPSKLDHLWIRGAGRLGRPGCSIDNAGVQATALRADHCNDEGIQVSDLAGDAENWIAEHCAKGIVLSAGTWNLVHATVADCSVAGLTGTGWTGSVLNTIAWNNASNYVGIADSQLVNSNGSATAAGMNGNLDLDPLFVDPATGDYHLQAMSPCLGMADVTTAHATLVDWDEGSRLADDDLSGNVLPDMGAFERITWHLDVQGAPSLGSTMTFTLAGSATGFGLLLVDFASASHEFFPDYGYLLIGLSSQVSIAATLTANLPFPAVIPNIPTLVGFPFEVQGIVLLSSDPSRGNFTQRYRGKVSP